VKTRSNSFPAIASIGFATSTLDYCKGFIDEKRVSMILQTQLCIDLFIKVKTQKQENSCQLKKTEKKGVQKTCFESQCVHLVTAIKS